MEKTAGFRCACPNVRCELHGNCKACRARHNGKPYCQLSGFRKSLNDWLCRIIIRR